MKRSLRDLSKLGYQDWLLGLCGVSAIIVSIAGFLGYWPFTQSDLGLFHQVLFFAVGLMISSLVSIFYLVKQLHKSINTPPEINYVTSFPQDEFDRDLLIATNIKICGIAMFSTISRNSRMLKIKAKHNAKIRFLIADPNGTVVQMAQKKYAVPVANIDKTIKATLELMKDIQKESPDNVEILTLDYLFSNKVMILERGKHGTAYVSKYTFRMSNHKAKNIYQKGVGNYFNFYKEEFDQMWQCAKMGLACGISN